MSYQDHLQNCSYCNNTQSHKPTVKIKMGSSYQKEKKLNELGALIQGISYSTISYPGKKSNINNKTKGASNISSVDKSQKLKELARLITG